MENEKNNQIEMPEFKYAYWFFWTKPAKTYRRQLKRFEDQFLTKSEKIRKQQWLATDSINFGLFAILTTCWTSLPSLIELPNWLQWAKLGMSDVSWQNNWAGGLVMLVVPASGGTLIQKSPYWFPQKRVQFFLNWILKIIPLLILCITTYWFKSQKRYKLHLQSEKENFDKEITKPIVSVIETAENILRKK